MLSNDKRDKLKSLLLGLDTQGLRALTRAIEYGRKVSETDLPSDEILDVIRPALAGIHPEHLPSIPRVLCEPCEDLFVPQEEGEEKWPGHIPRSIIAPYTAATRELVGKKIDGMEQRMMAAFLSQSWDELSQLKAEFWSNSAAAWMKKIEAGVDDSFREQFGGPAGIDNIKEVILCLRASEAILAVRRIQPNKPSGSLDGGQLRTLVELLERIATSARGNTGVVLLTAFRRLRDPASIQPLLDRMSKSTVTWPASATGAQAAIEAILAEADAESKLAAD